jgi:uncharacterized protein (DUF2267 family)
MTEPNIEKSVQKTYKWINDVQEDLEWENRHDALKALRETLHMLRDRLTVQEAVDLASQLPLELKGIYFDGWRTTSKPEKMDRTAFVSRVHSAFGNNPDIDPAEVVQTVLGTIQKKISNGEMQDIRSNLPKDIDELFVQKTLNESEQGMR